MRGYHLCDLCGATEPIKIKTEAGEIAFGDAEIHVSQGTKVHAAPNLLVHYIAAHGYQSPQEFAEAGLAA
jgi:hypothetical protein